MITQTCSTCLIAALAHSHTHTHSEMKVFYLRRIEEWEMKEFIPGVPTDTDTKSS